MKIRDIDQVKLSKLSGVRQPLISQYLSGRVQPSVEKIEALARALRIKPGDLFDKPTAESIQKAQADIKKSNIEELIGEAQNLGFGPKEIALLRLLHKKDLSPALARAIEEFLNAAPNKDNNG